MIIWEAVIEEIALEGLDGITLPTLWFRLQSRPDTEFVLDDAGKQWIWNFVRQRPDVLSFYQLAEPRPPLSVGGEDEVIADERLLYPINVITEGPLWGSCSTMHARLDVSDQICNGNIFGDLNETLAHFNPDCLVVMASQSERIRVLLGPSCEFSAVFRENAAGRQHYAMLERVGRSRYSGVNAGSNDSLHVLFNLRAKDVFYVLKRFEIFGIVKKQLASMVVNQSKLVTATVVMLSRYSTPLDRSRYLAPMRRLIAFLEPKPGKRAPFNEVKELFGVVTANFIKKMLQTFPGVVRTTARRVEVPYVSKKKKKGKKPNENGEEESMDVSMASAAVEEVAGSYESTMRKVIHRQYELIGRLHLDEDTGELLSTKPISLDETESTVGGEDEEEESAAGSAGTIDWSRYNPFRTRTFETMRMIRQSGAQGVDNLTLRQEIAADRKQMERLLINLKRGTQFKSVVENRGKHRKTKYVWCNAEHKAEQYYRKFEEITHLDLTRMSEKERLMLGERNIQRMLFILEYIEGSQVVVSGDFLRPLRELEQNQGYTHTLDKKCLSSLLKFLTHYEQLKTFITVLKEGILQRTVEFICHKRIELSSPELQSKISSLRLELSHLSARRMGRQITAKVGEKRLHHMSLERIAEKLLAEQDNCSKNDGFDGASGEGGPPQAKKPRTKAAVAAEKFPNLFNPNAQEDYGYQPRIMRAQLMHEFLYYLLLDMKTDCEQPFDEQCSFWEDAEFTTPRVYVQGESWRRFVPPLPVRQDLRKGWFRLGDILNRIPISLLVQIVHYKFKITGLAEEYLGDPIKRHYTLHHVHAGMRAALMHDRKAPAKLVETCNTLTAMGCISYGRNRKQESIVRLEDELYYMHTSSRIMDTSSALPSYHILKPGQYPDYVYRFSSVVDVHIFWLHIRAVAFSTRLGMRLFKTDEDAEVFARIMGNKGPYKGFLPIVPVPFDKVQPDGMPMEPRVGSAGFTPVLYLFRPITWKINTSSFTRWYFDEIRSRVSAYESIVAQRVSNLNSIWNAYFSFRPPMPKGSRNAVTVVRSTEKRRSRKSTDKSNEVASKTARQGWWPHPAVQKSLQQRKGNNVDRTRRKRGELDAADEASFAKRRKLRCFFSAREKQMLLLLRAVSYVFYTGSRLWVEASVIRDLMHKYVPESMDKTSKALAQSSARDLGTNPQAGETMIVMAEQIQKHKAIRLIKRRLATMANGPDEKRWAFTKAFEVARKMFYGSKAEINFEDMDLNTVFQEYDVSIESASKTLWPLEDVHSTSEIIENTAKRVIYCALGLSRRDGAFTSQLNMIYKSLPDVLLLRVIQRLRRNGMLVLRSRIAKTDTRAKRAPGENAPKRSGDFMLSFFYRHFFYHHFHVNLAKEAKGLIDLSRSQPDDWHNVLTDMPGYAAALVALSFSKQVYFDLTVPSNVVVYKDSNARTDATHENEGDNEEEDDWPRIISSTTALLQSEDDDYEDNDPILSLPSTSSQQPNQHIPITIKKEPETEAVHLACQSANKSVLFKLRQERLNACEASDSRSMNVRVRDLTLNSCTLMAKLAPNHMDTSAQDQARIREGLARLVNDSIVSSNQLNGQIELDAAKQTIWEMMNAVGALGMTEEEFRAKTQDDQVMLQHLNEMIEKGDVKASGVWKRRYVARCHIDPWTVTSLRLSKDDRSLTQDMVHDTSMQEIRGDLVKFLPRPWLKPDGTLNRPMLRWLCEGIFLRIMSMPSVAETYIEEQFISVLDPMETTQLIEFLVSIGCVTRIEKEFNQRKPRLFGPPIIEKVRLVCYEVPTDAVVKFAAAFDRTPMPEFVTSWLTGGTVSDRGAVFGRRRLRPAANQNPA